MTGPLGFNSLAVDTIGIPYVAYVDSANANRLAVKKFNTGTNIREVVGTGLSSGQAGSTSLTIYNGTPYVAYADGGD